MKYIIEVLPEDDGTQVLQPGKVYDVPFRVIARHEPEDRHQIIDGELICPQGCMDIGG